MGGSEAGGGCGAVPGDMCKSAPFAFHRGLFGKIRLWLSAGKPESRDSPSLEPAQPPPGGAAQSRGNGAICWMSVVRQALRPTKDRETRENSAFYSSELNLRLCKSFICLAFETKPK